MSFLASETSSLDFHWWSLLVLVIQYAAFHNLRVMQNFYCTCSEPRHSTSEVGNRFVKRGQMDCQAPAYSWVGDLTSQAELCMNQNTLDGDLDLAHGLRGCQPFWILKKRSLGLCTPTSHFFNQVQTITRICA